MYMCLQTADFYWRPLRHPPLSFHCRKLYFRKLVRWGCHFEIWCFLNWGRYQVPPTFILLLFSCVCYWASLGSKQRNNVQPLWWDLCVSLVPSGLGTGAVTGNCYSPFYAAILFPGRWRGWYPSAAPRGRAVTKGRATGRINTLFIDFLQLPAIPAVRLSVLIFFSCNC